MDAEVFINAGNMFLWKNGVASCKFAPNGDMASINLVFTRPEFRRKHYAENSMLYTDADYIASNACYEKIGYSLRGKLCTIS